MKGSGVYIIRNVVTEKVYVGSSVNVARRWTQHRVMLKGGNHHSPKLQKAWSKYGSEAFEFLVVEEVVDHNQLLEREQSFLNEYKSWTDKGYNILQIAGSREIVRPGGEKEMTSFNIRVNPRFKKALQTWSELEGVSQTHLITEYLKGVEKKVRQVEQANPSP